MSAANAVRERVLAGGDRPDPMDARHGLALGVAAGALLMGILAERLLWEMPWGIGAGLWIAALAGAAGVLAWRRGVPLRGEGRWFAAVAVLFAFALAWRAAPPLAVLNVMGVVLAVVVAGWRSRAGRLVRAGVGEYLRGLVMTVAHTAGGALALVIGDVPWRTVAPGGRVGIGVVVRGMLLAFPLLVVFGVLLANADPVFERLVSRLFDWTTEELLARVLFTAVWGWIAAGLLRQVLLGTEVRGLSVAPPRLHLSLGAAEAAVVLGLLNLLFLTFVVVQVRYLFGGAELVQAATGLTYAEYARRGFFELVAVSALVLPVLLALEALVVDEARGRRVFRFLSAALLVLLLVVIASAIQRMRLYQEAYGLTEQRLYATAFMAWMTVSLLWFGATVLRGRRSHFAFGALLAGFATLAVLNLMNPDALIARTNLAHARATGRLDTAYLAELGPDAAPVLLPEIGDAGDGVPCQYAVRLRDRLQRMEDPGWTTWNAGRARAAAELAAHGGEIPEAGCFDAGAAVGPR